MLEPKSPSEVIQDYKDLHAWDGPGVDEEWLKSALSSVVLWAAENIDPNTTIRDEDFYVGFEAGVRGSEEALIHLAKKIKEVE